MRTSPPRGNELGAALLGDLLEEMRRCRDFGTPRGSEHAKCKAIAVIEPELFLGIAANETWRLFTVDRVDSRAVLGDGYRTSSDWSSDSEPIRSARDRDRLSRARPRRAALRSARCHAAGDPGPLLDGGAITEAEFDDLKAKTLAA